MTILEKTEARPITVQLQTAQTVTPRYTPSTGTPVAIREPITIAYFPLTEAKAKLWQAYGLYVEKSNITGAWYARVKVDGE